MIITFKNPSKVSIESFALFHYLDFEIIQRNITKSDKIKLPKYYCHFADLEIVKENILISASGNGNTPHQAVKNYIKSISGQRVRFHDLSGYPVDMKVPKLYIESSAKEIQKLCNQYKY